MKNFRAFVLVFAAAAVTTGGCAQKVPDATTVAEPEEDLYFVRGYRSDDFILFSVPRS